MKLRKDSADRGAGSGCMARLVRCSSFSYSSWSPRSVTYSRPFGVMKRLSGDTCMPSMTAEPLGFFAIPKSPDSRARFRRMLFAGGHCIAAFAGAPANSNKISISN